LRFIKHFLGDERFVLAGENAVFPSDYAGIEGIFEDDNNRPVVSGNAAALAETSFV
jgi:hypothetical protein